MATSTLKVRVNEPPVAVAGPNQLLTTSLVHFDGTASRAFGGRISSYAWDFGDGTTGSGATVDHVYARHGRFNVRLTVTDDSGTERNTGTSTTTVVIKTPPIADAGARQVSAPGEKLVFDASRSLDPDGDITAYEWDFGDGTKASGRVVSHVFAKPGAYDVRLTVKDDSGTANGIDFAETRAVVNAPPVAKAGTNLIAAPSDDVRLDASGSYSPSGKIVSYRWDFSDGGPPVSGAKVARRFDKPGVYTAHLTVADDSGAANSTAADEIKIAVNDRPVAVAGPDIVTDRLVVAFDGTRSIDADGDPLTFRWDFGDGTTGVGAKVLHTYAEGGTYPVVLVVDDGRGLSNSTSRATLQLSIHRPPTAVAGDSRRVCTGDVITFDGSKSRDQQGGALRYAWDFGDGTTADIVNPTKSYKRAGVYPVTLKVQDNSGLPNSTHMQRVTVTVDQGPIAVAGQSLEACARSEVHFDGTKSFDPHGAITRFTWDFGDGGIGGGDRPAHIYEKPGEYRVFLKIDGTGVGRCEPTSSDQITVHIIKGPVPIIVAREAVPVSETVTFDGSGSYMTGGRILVRA
jgi:PKD repeat protein